MTEPLLEIVGLSKTFVSGGRRVAAVESVSFDIRPGETVGLVGGSGSGKSTLARLLLRLTPPESGRIRFEGKYWLDLSGNALRRARARLQMVFQDPLAAFNPRATVADVLMDPLRIHGTVASAARPKEVERLLERVGLPSALAERSVLDVSGGQRQRVAIARALATKPALIVLDEAVSALDVSVRRKVLELLVELQKESGLAYLFISHDLAVVRAVSHRVLVMEAGRIVEAGTASRIIEDPQSDAAKALVKAVPKLESENDAAT